MTGPDAAGAPDAGDRRRPPPVEVWTVDLARAVPRDARQPLSKDELRRAERFVHERDRSRWVRARSALRHILSRHTGVPPSEIEFTYGRFGKPSVSRRTAEVPPPFNLSHAGDVAVVAVGADTPLGVDIERCPDDRLRFDDLAPLCLSKTEYREMSGLEACVRERALVRTWTCKEAYVKATGRGLSIPPHLIETRSTATGAPELVSVNGSRGAVEGWSLTTLRTVPGYTGALASRNAAGTRVSYSRYTAPEE